MNENVATKAELWADRIKEFQNSGLPRREWCQTHDIPLSTFNYWFRKQRTEVLADAPCDEPIFTRLPSEQEFYSTALLEHPPVTVFLPEKVRIEVSADCPGSLMVSLLHALMSHA